MTTTPGIVDQYLSRRQAVADAQPTPFRSNPDPNGRRPAPTGDPVADYLARTRWAARRAPNPLRSVIEDFKRLPQR